MYLPRLKVGEKEVRSQDHEEMATLMQKAMQMNLILEACVVIIVIHATFCKNYKEVGECSKSISVQVLNRGDCFQVF